MCAAKTTLVPCFARAMLSGWKRFCFAESRLHPPNAEIHKTALGAEDSVKWRYFHETLQAVDELKSSGYTVFSVEQTKNSLSLEHLQIDKPGKYALVLGHEVHGVQQEVIDVSDGSIEIPPVRNKTFAQRIGCGRHSDMGFFQKIKIRFIGFPPYIFKPN